MARIAVIGANGKAGRAIVSEAVSRGHDVTAIVRGDSKTKAQHVISKDLFNLHVDDLNGFDAVVDAFGTSDPSNYDQHRTSLHYLSELLADSPTRLLVVGGAGSLYTNPEHTEQLCDSFPEDIKPIPEVMGKALEVLRRRDDVRWTYISPAAQFLADGERTGSYELTGEEYTTDARGESTISYADYAIAMLDEIERGGHIHQRISVRW